MTADPPPGEGFWLRGRQIHPALALAVLAPVVAELLSGSTPLSLFWIPPLLGINLGLYGAGAVLIREAVVRAGKGWPSILALGVAYGIVEEGLALFTFFDPSLPQRIDANLGAYGAGPDGANWVWIATLCVYHSVISIALPIGLVNLAYPSRAGRPFLPKKGAAFAAVMLAWTVFVLRLVVHGHIDEGQQNLSLLACVLLAILAWRLPRRIGPSFLPGGAPSPRRMAIAGFLAIFAFFIGFGWGGKGFGLPAEATIAGVVLVPLLAAIWLARVSARKGWSDRHRFAFAAGMLCFFVMLEPIEELAGKRLQLLTCIVLVYALRRAWRHFRRAAVETPGGLPPVSVEPAPA